jgi:hypothetical protein
MLRGQNNVLPMICLSTDLVSGKPPVVINGVTVPNDSVCEVCNVVSGEIDKVFKMNGGVWYEYTY